MFPCSSRTAREFSSTTILRPSLRRKHELGIADLAGRRHVAQPVGAVLGVYV
jgi:hypothetical protein